MSNKKRLNEIVQIYAKKDNWHSLLFMNLNIVGCGNENGQHWINSELLVKNELIDVFGNFDAGLFNALFDVLSILLCLFIGKPFTLSVNLAVNCLKNVDVGQTLKSRIIVKDIIKNIVLYKAEAFINDELVAIGFHNVKILEKGLISEEKL